MTSTPSSRGAVLALLATIVIWAYSWVVMKQVLQHAGPFDFAAIRYVLGALVLFGALLATRQSLRPPPLLSTVLIGLCQTTAFQGLGQWALVSGGAGHVALLAYTMPFWAVLLAWMMLDEGLTSRRWLGLGLAAIGLTCIIEPWHGLGNTQSTLLAIGAGLAWAMGTVLSKRVFQRHAPSPLSLTAWQMLFGALGLVLVALCVPQRPIEWTWGFIGGLVYSVVIASSLAWGLWLLVLHRLPTAIASVASLGVPIVSVLLAWAILHEQPTAMEFVGIAFILAGLIAVSGIGLRGVRAAGR
ncbi:Threonine/homoserine efflux transporter RhtA [Dyella jiangningensis]|uniref:DMT family transporter n=2 Tax=Gammaproteobacteria TaxID=1236 RepID=UPI00088B469F|nr:DMT family transporter [Dyella sp. AtDHG13]PXV52888.1 threonine/homoserine efflux transporter RhtA [Dyella sp. AtDHG13]SDK28695.1 Threonine/homoserine efflux transporter RhtA [Dyella jiangningensis]